MTRLFIILFTLLIISPAILAGEVDGLIVKKSN